MRYEVIFAPKATKDLKRLTDHRPAAYHKALKLINELYVHPREGTGKPEQLRGD